MITWYRCGQSTFSSCDHVGRQKKAKIYKSTIGQKNQMIKRKVDKIPKRENVLILQQSRCTIPWSHDTGVDSQHCRHMLSGGRTEKSQNGQKHHRTKEPKNKNPSGQNCQKRKCFNTLTIKLYDPMIIWYRCGQSTVSSFDHVGRQRKAKMDKSTIGQKPQRIKIKVDKTPKRENVLILQQSLCTIPWSHDTGVDNQHSCHAIMWADREKPKFTKAP